MEHTVKTKHIALRQLLQYLHYPVVVFLQVVGMLPRHFVFHCLYWHAHTVVPHSSAAVAVLVRRDARVQLGDFVHHAEGRAIILDILYLDVPVQLVNVYMSAKGRAKEYRPLLQWLRAHVAPDSHLVLMGGGDFQCNPGWARDCVSTNSEVVSPLLEFVDDMQMHPFLQGTQGPTWVSDQGFVGALDFFS